MSGIIGSKLNIRGSGLVGSLGTDGQHLLSSGAGKTNVFETSTGAVSAADLTTVRQDVLTLALKQAVTENQAAFNLPSSFIDQFEDDTGIATETNVNRTTADEMVSSVYTDVGAFSDDGNTVLLLHLDNNTTDSSSNEITVTNNGSMAFNTSNKKLGTHSALFDGTDDFLSTVDLASVDDEVTTPTTGNFTIEMWLKYISRDAGNRLFSLGNTGTPASGSDVIALTAGYNSSTNMNTYGEAGNLNYTYPSEDTTTFHHYAFMRSGTTFYLFFDGVRKGDTTGLNGHDMQRANGTLFIGSRSNTTTEYINGYMDEFRYSNSARYSTSGSTGDSIFTPNSVLFNNATGTLISAANTVTARTAVSGVALYKDTSGTATIGTDLKIYFACDGGAGSPDWTETSYTAVTPVFSSGIKMLKLGQVTGLTSGTDVRYKAVWANQSSGSKVTELHGIGLNY